MAFIDNENKQEVKELADKQGNCSPENNWRIWVHCPYFKRVNYSGMDGDWYECEKCGRSKFHDYEETK